MTGIIILIAILTLIVTNIQVSYRDGQWSFAWGGEDRTNHAIHADGVSILTELDRVHPTTPANVTIIRCFAIFGDFDGSAPSTATMVRCATRELANQLISLLGQLDGNGFLKIRGETWEPSLPFIEGSSDTPAFEIREEFATPGQVVTTLRAALEELCLG